MILIDFGKPLEKSRKTRHSFHSFCFESPEKCADHDADISDTDTIEF